MSQHHEAGPSQLGRIVLCPGSLLLVRKAREQGAELKVFADAAQSGTDLHALADPSATIPDGLDPLDLQAVINAREWIDDKTRRLRDIEYEKRVEIIGGIFGTVDVHAWSEEDGHLVLDLKFGHGQLSGPILEWQMKAYAAAFTEGCSVAVYQARERTEYGAFFTASDIDQIRSQILAIVRTANESAGQYSPSPDACRYCPAAGICPAFEKQTLSLVNREEALPLDAARLAYLYEAVKLVESRGDAIRDSLKAAIKAGANVGYRIKEVQVRQAPRKEEVLSKLTAEEALRAAKFSLGELEKAVGKARIRDLFPDLGTSTQERIERLSS